ncbi:sodium-dependent glucose transporter 1-like protein [Leptotrombidium deliense]|uniref:Sodium-dependent glucose transporter 1-like protein n=1 Tax=Leptotrombidium deliense TaxID=299467 RepID=A0A443SG82_9ACAR|nr:sodium-dependent glucose transporter 1-like protein [Leptotrombidium deliense]
MSILTEIKNNKLSFLKTVLGSLMYLVIGLSMAIPGPTLLDLQIAVNCSLEQISYLLPSRACGYVIGSFAGGFIPKNTDKQPFIVICITAVAILLGLLPWNTNLWVLIANGALIGINVFILHLWGKKSPPFIQFAYFFYGLGAFIAPLLAEPFLLPVKFDDKNSTKVHVYTREDLKIHFPYAMVSMYSTTVVIIFSIIYCLNRETKAHSSLAEKKSDDCKKSKKTKIFAVLVAAFFIKIYFGIAISFGSFLAAFAVKCKLNLLKSTAAMLTSAFWGTFTLFRIPVTLAMNFIGIRNLIIFELFLMFCASIPLQLFGESNVTILWIAVVIMGCSLSSVFALVLGYLQQHIKLTNAVLSLFLISACVGEFLFPTILAKFIDQKPNVFTIICSVCTVSSSFVFVLLELVCRKLR